MDIILYSDGDSPVHRIDPRVRILAAVAITLVISQSQYLGVTGVAFALAVVGMFIARMPLAAVLQRLVPLNALLLLLVLLLLFTVPGDRLFAIGNATATAEGGYRGLLILGKGNAIVGILAVLIGTIEFVALGKALGQLRVPEKLVNILLMTVRYINLMLAEYERLSRAAQLRGFQPGANRHTLTTTGYLVGMVLVRSYDRGARILQAMKLRGYTGELQWGDDPSPLQRTDYLFVAIALGTLALLAGLELQ